MTDVFNQDDPKPNTPHEPEGGFRATLVGEGKKYATDEDLAKAYDNAARHITTLEGELAELRAAGSDTAKVQEVLDELKKLQVPAKNHQEDTTPRLDESKILELVESRIDARQTEAQKRANKDEANLATIQAWGDNAGQHLAQRASELGVSLAFLQEVAEKSPSAYKQLIGIGTTSERKPEEDNPPHRRQTPAPNTPAPGGEHLTENDWGYWQNMRKTDSKRYYSREMNERRVELRAEGKLRLPGDDG